MVKYISSWININTDSNLQKLITDGLFIKNLKIFMIWFNKENNISKTKNKNIKKKCSNNNNLIEKNLKPLKESFVTSILTM
jgi:hypothetical protein